MSVSSFLPDLRILAEDHTVDVAVAGVPAPDDDGTLGQREVTGLAKNCGIDARGMTTSMMSSAPISFAAQNVFSRA